MTNAYTFASSIALLLLGYFLGKYREKHNRLAIEFNKAAAIFRTAFIEQIRELRGIVHTENLEPNFVYTLIENAIVDHEIAFIRFEPYLKRCDITSYHNAWEQYRHTSDIPKETTPDSLEGYYAHTKSVKGCIHLAISNIERLLKFANPQ